MDKIRNRVVRDLVKVALIEDKIRETKLRWFGHVKRRSVDVSVRRCKMINALEGKEGGGGQRRVGTR